MALQLINKDEFEMPDQLNFGCGNTIDHDMVNVDAHISDTIKGLTKGSDVWLYEGLWTDPHEFPVGQFLIIEAFDVLEHFHPDMIGNILYCFRCSMKEGGLLKIKVPDFEAMAQEIADHINDGKMSSIEWRKKFRRIELIWMAPYLHKGIGHQSIWTKAMSKYRLEREGFEVTHMETKNLTLSIYAKRL